MKTQTATWKSITEKIRAKQRHAARVAPGFDSPQMREAYRLAQQARQCDRMAHPQWGAITPDVQAAAIAAAREHAPRLASLVG